MEELDDILKHYGVKGMKWGVVRWRKPGGKSGQTRKRGPNRMKQTWDSLKRERHWHKVLKDIDNMTTKEINAVAKRAQLENEFKKLVKRTGPKIGSKPVIATSKDRADYRRRAEMSDEELNRKVGRLRAKNALGSQAHIATKQQREVGERIAQTGGSLLIKYATTKKLTPGDIYESVANPKAAQTQAVKTVLDTTMSTAAKKAANVKAPTNDKDEKWLI